ncbi:MAG TPA: branched-chain amino acid aminotransferase [Sulfurimonas autotrophica]|nr:branched-chain amino acid aminotransferase [Sulfurimonas autotrophica]
MNNIQYLETIKAVDGELFHLNYHQQRLNETLGNKKILLAEILKPPTSGLFRCRVVYNARNYRVSYHPYEKRIVQKLKLVFDDTIEYSRKYYDRSPLERLLEKKSFCDDILIVKNRLITDTSIANIALQYKNEWLTPREPLLYGTTRARLLDEKKIFEDDIAVEDLKKFKQMALMNAMIDFDIIQNENIKEIVC